MLRTAAFSKLLKILMIFIALFFSIDAVAEQNAPKSEVCEEPAVLTGKITVLYKNAKGDAYQLSMPLLASAQLGDAQLYQSILPKMQKSLKNIPEDDDQNSYKAWLSGRVLLAAAYMNDQTTMTNTKTTLKTLLANPKTKKDAFAAWAWGYLAGSDKTEYESARTNMVDSAKALTTEYLQEQQKNPGNKVTLQSKLSDSLWAWVMALQASAKAGDNNGYHTALQQIKTLAQQDSIAASLTNGLLRTSESNDYPAWALAIARLAAANMQDQMLYTELDKPLANSILAARQAGATAEEILAQTNEMAAIKKNSLAH